MAIIYDLSTGSIISENEGIVALMKPEREPECPTALQPVDSRRTPDQSNPCDAYMVLLQRLLKDL
jgi:hypothetical protein